MTSINNISPKKYVPVRKQKNSSYNAKTGEKKSLINNQSSQRKLSKKAA